MKVAANFVEWSMKKLIKEVESNIDGEMSIKHSKIAAVIERMIDNHERISQFNQKYGYDIDPEGQLFDFPLSVLIQSGREF